MKATPNGIGQLVIGPYAIKSFQITTLVMGPVPAIASYGEDPVDTQAREPFLVMKAAIIKETIVNLSAEEALSERQKIKQHLGVTARVSAETLKFAKNQFDKWQLSVDFETQISWICTNIIARSIFGLNPVKLEAIPVLKAMSEMIVHSKPGKADFEQASADLLTLSKQIINASADKIIQDQLYLYDQIADQNLTDKSSADRLKILQETHGGGALIVESNLSALCAMALAKIFATTSIRERLIHELNCVDISDFEQLDKLSYLNALYAETLRFVSPTSVIARRVGQDAVLSKVTGNDGVKRSVPILKGTYLFSAIRREHFDQEYWPNPEQFKPERFETTPSPRFSGPHFFPFAAGPRSCPAGGIFVNVAFKTLIAFVVKNYTLALDKPLENIPINTLHPRWENQYFVTELNLRPSDQFEENVTSPFNI
ncbi:cytochrome P450 [Legionella sp. km535]|uniref:cytochrome P450 n=1 Tax=Legionella sp. km535 TaxID=2498107 RepID=UPI000F8D9B1D|nr:cytochrome P450 [Legionella sp. km535]RUR20204.1 cytochrome P450 [Legionella sp. km535]